MNLRSVKPPANGTASAYWLCTGGGSLAMDAIKLYLMSMMNSESFGDDVGDLSRAEDSSWALCLLDLNILHDATAFCCLFV